MIRAARAAGYQPQLASPPGVLIDRLTPHCSAVYELPLVPLRRTSNPNTIAQLLLGWVKGSLQLGRIIRRSNSAVVHANSGAAALAACLPARVTRRPLVWHQHDIVPSRLVNRVVLAPASLLTGRVVACSNAVRESLLRIGIGRKRVVVMHNRVRGVFFEPLVAREQALHALNLSGSWPIVTMAGRLVPYKAHSVFLDALALLKLEGVDVLGVIAGDKPSLGPHDVDPFPGYKADLLRRAARPDLAGRVIFLGHCDDIRLVYAAGDILIQPSIDEPFPLVVLEGLASGIPVIASASGGHIEAITNGTTGILTPPGDAISLASAIRELLMDETLRKVLGAAGQLHAHNSFGESGLPADLSELYRSILNKCPGTDTYAAKASG